MHETFVTVLGLTGLLAITSLLLPVARRLNFPYTVLLAAVGIIFGFVVEALHGVEGLWVVGDFVTALGGFEITSEIVFFVFLRRWCSNLRSPSTSASCSTTSRRS